MDLRQIGILFFGTIMTALNSFLPVHKSSPLSTSTAAVLGDTTTASTNPIFFTVNVPATFKQDISAPNIIYSLKPGTGISITHGQTPIISSTGILTLQAGSGISVEGNKITNTLIQGITSLTAGDGISIDGNKITNSLTQGLTSLVAGTGIGVSGNIITNTATPDYTLSGWTDSNGIVTLTNPSNTLDFASVGVANAGSITGITGLTSSGQITFSDFSTGIVHSNFSGVLSSSAVNLESSDVTGTLPPTRGGTGLTSYTIGDIPYSTTTNTLGKLGIGSTGQVLIVSDNGVPSWGTITGGSEGICSNCLVTDPGSAQIITPTGPVTGLAVRKAPSGTADIFKITDITGNSNYLTVDNSGNIIFGNGTVSALNTGIFTVNPTNSDPITIVPVSQGANSYTGTITSADLNQNRIWTFPDESGIVCTTSGNCTGTSSSLGGSGVNNYLAKWQNTYSMTNSQLYDDGTFIGIGTTAPSYKLDIIGTGRISGEAIFGSDIGVTGATTLSSTLDVNGATNFLSTFGVAGAVTLSSTVDITGNTTIGGNLHANGAGIQYLMGNVGIGTTAPTGKFQVDIGNTQAFFVSSTGNVGIGTSNPTSRLTLIGNPTITLRNSEGSDYLNILVGSITQGGIPLAINGVYHSTSGHLGVGIQYPTGKLQVNIGNTQAFFVSSTNGYVGIGTTSPTYKLDVSGGYSRFNGYGIYVTGGNSSFGGLGGIDGSQDPALNVYPTQTNRIGLAIKGLSSQTGNLLEIRNSSNNKLFFVSATGNVSIGTTATEYKLQVGEAGDGTEARANSWNSLSDSRFKENIIVSGGLDKIMQLNGVSFSWKTNGKTSLGLIAQDVQNVFPELVSTDEQGILSLNYAGLSAPIIEAIKEQQAEIDKFKFATPSATIDSSYKSDLEMIRTMMNDIKNIIANIQKTIDDLKNKLTTKQLCVGDNTDEVCINKDDLKNLLKLVPTAILTATPTPPPSIEPSTEAITPTVTVEPTTAPTTEPTMTPTLAPTNKPYATPTFDEITPTP